MAIQFLVNGLINGCLYALMGLGFALIYNTTRIFHIAHGALYTAGAYLCYTFLVLWGWPVAAAAAAAVLGAAGLGALTEALVYAPLDRRRASPLVALLSSLGMYIAAVNVIALVFGNENKVLRPGVEPTLHLGSALVTRIQLIQVLTAGLVLSAVGIFLGVTRWGRLIRAMRDNPTLLRVLGVNLPKLRLLVFALGSSLAALAGVLAALDVGMDPHVGMPALLIAAVALIVGGIGTFSGAILGAFLLGVLQSLVIWQLSSRWTDAIIFSLFIVFLLVRPEGLLGRRSRLEEAPS